MKIKTTFQILFSLYALLAALFAHALFRQKRINDASDYCMTYVYRELDALNGYDDPTTPPYH
jgi:hypothetical protein